MPNPVVPANAGGMPKLDRAALMRRARRSARTYKGREWSYVVGLKAAWKQAKSGQTPAEIDALKNKPPQMNIDWRRKALDQQLSPLVT